MATTKSWVTKTDLVRFWRCPYAFWLVDSGQVKPGETISPLAGRLMANGVAFQAKVESAAVPIELPAGGLDELFRREGLTLCKDLPMFENPRLRTRGLPDAIETAGGALYPVEVKSHREVNPLDRIELAFYWSLLAPRRTRFPSPEGVLVLRDGVEAREVRVGLTRADFDELNRLIAAVRRARAEGVEPRVCNCYVCSQRPEVLAFNANRADLSMVFGISRIYSTALAAMGCTRHDQLEALVPAEVVAHFRARRLFISPAAVASWQLHARAYAEGRPLLAQVREPLPPLGRYIALDLEWDLEGRIWLVGAGVVATGEVDHTSWWADDPDEERCAFEGIARFLDAHPGLPVLTWNGKSADLPQLAKRVAAFSATEQLVPVLSARHFDLFLWAQRYLRLPMPGLALKDVAQAFNYSATSGVGSGTEAMMLYERYRETKEPALRQQLATYNRDDVASLAAVAAHLVVMDSGPVPRAASLSMTG